MSPFRSSGLFIYYFRDIQPLGSSGGRPEMRHPQIYRTHLATQQHRTWRKWWDSHCTFRHVCVCVCVCVLENVVSRISVLRLSWTLSYCSNAKMPQAKQYNASFINENFSFKNMYVILSYTNCWIKHSRRPLHVEAIIDPGARVGPTVCALPLFINGIRQSSFLVPALVGMTCRERSINATHTYNYYFLDDPSPEHYLTFLIRCCCYTSKADGWHD